MIIKSILLDEGIIIAKNICYIEKDGRYEIIGGTELTADFDSELDRDNKYADIIKWFGKE